MKGIANIFGYRVLLAVFFAAAPLAGDVYADDIVLTADSVIEIAMRNSYRFRILELSRKRRLSSLNAERASLKSRVYMNLKTPEYSALSDYKWNSTLYMNEIIKTNTRRWQMDLAVKQPVIILGYPTNGYLSLNNRSYKYIQKEDFGDDVDYYNRFFVKFEQPLFTTNELKNDMEEAELDSKIDQMEDISDKVNEIIGISSAYNRLLNLVQRDSLITRYIRDLEGLLTEVKQKREEAGIASVEEIQVGLEIKNAGEMQLDNLNDIRSQAMSIKQRIRVGNEDSLIVKHDLTLHPLTVNIETALQHGYTLSPRLRSMSLSNRKVEIDLDNTKGWDSFRLDFAVSFGIENNDDIYREMWDEATNSYTFSLYAYLPIWDWGRRHSEIQAAEISVKRAYLYHDQVRDEITNAIITAVDNLNDYQSRVMAIGKTLGEAKLSYDTSLDRYHAGELSLQGVLKTLERKLDLEKNYLEAYIGYRGSILQLNARTFFDYESGLPMQEKYNL